MRFSERLKTDFGYDATALPSLGDNTVKSGFITDLIQNSTFLKSFTLEEGVKGTREIALLNANVMLQKKQGCSLSPDGSVVFTKEDLKTELIGAEIEFCNEDLNRKMTEVLNVIGLKRQNGQLPAELDTILMAYLLKRLQAKVQRVAVLGDTASSDTELKLVNGLIKILDDSTDKTVVTSTETAITSANAYSLAEKLYFGINHEVLDNGLEVVIYTGRTEATAILQQWNADKPYNQMDVPNTSGTFEFNLPLYGIKVVALPELTGKNKMYALPMSLWFFGTDLESDFSFDVKYDDYNEKLKATASFRMGIAGVWKKYSTILKLS